ncbi:aspartic proteinase nepenthesin-2 [Morus notabilis]|uniref:aspartic proteinase nepenthesin-2 n=1 Tax=Morus notabilis TaxID=981085 RepID=UPI000CED3722|nr:aspartic proteinase nepenthesin-2 [Morus notabilis]
MKPAKTILPLLFLFLISFSILLPCGKATTSNNNGFSIKLIPRDSPESPFFPGKSLTHKDRMKRLVNHSNVRLQHYVTHPSTVRLPMMSLKGILFMAKVGIGTLPSTPTSPPQKSLFLLIDTGSDLIWTQCETRLPNPPFPNSHSSLNHPLPCDRHPLCFKGQCNRKACSYARKYADDSSSKGILATETFTFGSHRTNVS